MLGFGFPSCNARVTTSTESCSATQHHACLRSNAMWGRAPASGQKLHPCPWVQDEPGEGEAAPRGVCAILLSERTASFCLGSVPGVLWTVGNGQE